MFQNVFIIGTGNVGGTVVDQIFSDGDTNPPKA
jgi:homoserine dehydrogenase